MELAHSGTSIALAKSAHNPKVVGSNPAPATKNLRRSDTVNVSGLFSLSDQSSNTVLTLRVAWHVGTAETPLYCYDGRPSGDALILGGNDSQQEELRCA